MLSDFLGFSSSEIESSKEFNNKRISVLRPEMDTGAEFEGFTKSEIAIYKNINDFRSKVLNNCFQNPKATTNSYNLKHKSGKWHTEV